MLASSGGVPLRHIGFMRMGMCMTGLIRPLCFPSNCLFFLWLASSGVPLRHIGFMRMGGGITGLIGAYIFPLIVKDNRRRLVSAAVLGTLALLVLLVQKYKY